VEKIKTWKLDYCSYDRVYDPIIHTVHGDYACPQRDATSSSELPVRGSVRNKKPFDALLFSLGRERFGNKGLLLLRCYLLRRSPSPFLLFSSNQSSFNSLVWSILSLSVIPKPLYSPSTFPDGLAFRFP
jgi:hypothetical protein